MPHDPVFYLLSRLQKHLRQVLQINILRAVNPILCLQNFWSRKAYYVNVTKFGTFFKDILQLHNNYILYLEKNYFEKLKKMKQWLTVFWN